MNQPDQSTRPRKFRIVLHIGTEKTGSSTLQHVLKAQQSALNRQGVYYYASQGRIEARGLASAALGDKSPDDYLRDLGQTTPEQRNAFRQSVVEHWRNTLDALPASIHTVVLSSEHFHSRLRGKQQVAWLYQLLREYAHEMRVVVYLRRQVDLIASYYSTMLKNGSVEPLETIAKRTCKPENHYYNYKTMLCLWDDVCANAVVVPRLFDSSELYNNDLVADFMQAACLPMAILPDSESLERHNESLTALGQGLLRALNKLCSQLEGTENDARLKQCKRLAVAIRRQFSGTGCKLPFDTAMEVQARFDESNAAVCERWFPGQAQLFGNVQKGECVNPIPRRLHQSQRRVVERVLDVVAGAGVIGMQELDPCVDYLRDVAVRMEQKQPSAALDLMLLARRIRSDGPFINKKIEQYRENQKNPSSIIRGWFRPERD